MSEGREKEGRKDHSTAIADLLRVRDVLRDCAERMEREPYQYTRATLWHRLKAAALAVDPEMWGQRVALWPRSRSVPTVAGTAKRT